MQTYTSVENHVPPAWQNLLRINTAFWATEKRPGRRSQWIPWDEVLIWNAMHEWKTISMVVGTGWGIRGVQQVFYSWHSQSQLAANNSQNKPIYCRSLNDIVEYDNHDWFPIKLLFMLEKLQFCLIENLSKSQVLMLTFPNGSPTGGGLVTWMCEISNSTILSSGYYLKWNFSYY